MSDLCVDCGDSTYDMVGNRCRRCHNEYQEKRAEIKIKKIWDLINTWADSNGENSVETLSSIESIFKHKKR